MSTSSGISTRAGEKSREPSPERQALPFDGDGAGAGDAPLLSYDEIPDWYQDNPFIWHGYRPVCNSARSCFRSWFHLHNEFINIHSHLWSAVFFLLGECFILAPLHLRSSRVSAGDYAVLAVFLLTVTACFGFSAAYHTFICHSQAAESFWLRFDFVGIILLILGSFMTAIYVSFWCELTEKIIYWAMIGVLGTLSFLVILHPKLQGLQWRTLRLLTFVFTGLCGFAPIAHGIYMFGFSQMVRQAGLPYYFAECGVFLLAAAVYGTRFPERFKPGTFDIFGSSHQIFHILVVFATAIHLAGVLTAMDYNYLNRQCSAHYITT